MKGRIIGREGRNIRALEQATGIDLIIDDTPETVVLSGFDPVRREVARIALTKLIADGRIHPGRIEEVVAKARAEVDLVIRQAGETGRLRRRRPGPPAPRSSRLLGRLKFRTSYGQNVLNHVRRDQPPRGDHRGGDRRRRPGRQDGRPAPRHRQGDRPRGRGAARRHRRPDRPAPRPLASRSSTRIAAHHQEVEYACLEAPIVQIADAISASRPGARGESMDTYVKRLEDLQAIADSFAGRRALVRRPGRARGPDPGPPRGDRRPDRDPPGPRHRARRSRSTLTYPGPDQGDGDPRDAGRRVREVGEG